MPARFVHKQLELRHHSNESRIPCKLQQLRPENMPKAWQVSAAVYVRLSIAAGAVQRNGAVLQDVQCFCCFLRS
jgi:hypothetical protein